MCREMSEEGYCVVFFGTSPLQNEFLRRRKRDFLSKKKNGCFVQKDLWHPSLAERISAEEKAGLSFEEEKRMLRAENLKRYKGKSFDCGAIGAFSFIIFSSDSSALHISFFSGNPAHSLLRRNSSAWEGAQDPYGGGEYPGKWGKGDACGVRCRCKVESCTPEVGKKQVIQW